MRVIPGPLLAHKKKSATSLCQIIRIETTDGEVLGMTTLDRDITYDDGRGSVLYKAAIGFQPASIYSSADFGVDNTEIQSLVPEFDLEMSEYRVNAGVYNYARFVMYELNYEQVSMGHWVVMSGTLGEVTSHDGITIIGELRSIMDQFRKPLCELDSIGCRAIFGSQPKGSLLEGPVERFPCGFDTSTLWVTGAVTTVGIENNRTFTDTVRIEADGYFEPGMMQWTSGMNAGFYVEIESSLATGVISLNFPTPYPIQIGDTYRIRRDCSKIARDDVKGCKFWYGANWPLHLRAEPDIPLGDAGTITTPGAGVGPGSGGGTHEDSPETDPV